MMHGKLQGPALLAEILLWFARFLMRCARRIWKFLAQKLQPELQPKGKNANSLSKTTNRPNLDTVGVAGSTPAPRTTSKGQ